ncbi:MAG: SDR family oxidoreductase, partial [Acidobacteria bacterium]|nr:SDR family oxidoreductase [Acidobacteriota bacterium]
TRVALVAAGSKGLGLAVARELAAEGASVGICARGADALDAAVAAIRAGGGRAHGVVADVSVASDIARAVSETASALGPIDILVTNSGGPKSGRFETLSTDDWDAASRVLLSSAVAFTRAVLPQMRARGWGRIINVTSIAAKQPVEGLMLSNSLRAAVIAFARTLANEVAADGITVNNLLPGYTRTERVVDLSSQIAARESVSVESVYARWEQEIPMKRLGEPREFAALAAFLASDRASYITGQSIAVDGGWIKGMF